MASSPILKANFLFAASHTMSLTRILPLHPPKCHFHPSPRSLTHQISRCYRKNAPQVTPSARPMNRPLRSQNSRPVNKKQMQVLEKRRLRRDRDTRIVRQWRNDLFRADTIPYKKRKVPRAANAAAQSQHEQDNEEESEKPKVASEFARYEFARRNREKSRQMMRLRNSLQVLPDDVEELHPLAKKTKMELYATLRTTKVTLPTQEFVDLLQDPFRASGALIDNDAPLREQLQLCAKFALKSRLVQFFATYESYFRISEETVLVALKDAQSKQDLWYLVNYLRRHESQRYLDNKLHKMRHLLTTTVAQRTMIQAHKFGTLQDMYTVFALFYESPLVNNFEYMQYADDEEYALFSNDKRWKLVPSSADYILLIEHALMKSEQPNYDVEQTIMALMKDPQMSYAHRSHETKIIEYWIHAYIMGGELNQALDVYRYYVKSKITYDRRVGEAHVVSTHKMEEPLREAFALSGDEQTYTWFCENVCPQVLPNLEDIDAEDAPKRRTSRVAKKRPLLTKRVMLLRREAIKRRQAVVGDGDTGDEMV